MTSSNGNIFRFTGHLCWEFTGPGEFPAQRPMTRSFDVSFDLHPNKRLSKQSRGWWFETQSRPLWRQCNVNASKGCCDKGCRREIYLNLKFHKISFAHNLYISCKDAYKCDITVTCNKWSHSFHDMPHSISWFCIRCTLYREHKTGARCRVMRLRWDNPIS